MVATSGLNKANFRFLQEIGHANNENRCGGWGLLLGMAAVLLGCYRGAAVSSATTPVEVMVSQPIKEKIEDWDTYTGKVVSKGRGARSRRGCGGEIKEVLFKKKLEGKEIPTRGANCCS